jgi:hypothetical protein
MASTPYQTSNTIRTPGIYTINLGYALADIAAADLLTDYIPGHNFKILGINAIVTKAATTAAKAATVTPKIGTTAIPNSALALTSANMTPLGKVVAGLVPVTGNTGGPTDKISLTGSAVTAFVEGTATITVTIQNTDNT